MVPSHGAEDGSTVALRGRVVLADRVVEDGAVVVHGGRVGFAGPRREVPARWQQAPVDSVCDEGVTILPGLVDIHCHGGSGGEFGTDTASAWTAVRHHQQRGSTTVVGSLVSRAADALVGGLGACAPLVETGALAGVHVEGPFLSTIRCGAQNPDHLLRPDLGLLERLADVVGPGTILQMTWAPELEGSDALPRTMAELGIVGAVGHTDADFATARRAFQALNDHPARTGRGLATHLFNGMPPMLSRSPGAVAAALSAAAQDLAVVEVIADGVHLSGGTVQMLFDTLGPDKIALISDAMSAAGLPSGDYELGGSPVRVRGTEARLLSSDSLAGGVSCLLDQVRWCVAHLGIPLVDAVRAASATPAAVLGLEEVGALQQGKVSDLLVVDASLMLLGVMRRGVWLGTKGSRTGPAIRLHP